MRFVRVLLSLDNLLLEVGANRPQFFFFSGSLPAFTALHRFLQAVGPVD